MKNLLLLLFLTTSVQVFAGIPLSTNFTVNTALPIDDRLSVADTTARDALSSLRRWEGMLVYVVADGKHYTLIGGITNGDWVELSGSGSGGGISGWLTATPYVIGDVVIESARIYVCKADHTSGTFATDLAANWTELSQPENLTGPIASTGGVTSITSQTGTGTKFVVDTSPTLITPDIGAATGTSITLTDKMLSGYQTPDNMAKNGDVELTDITMFTCGASNTCARTTASGEYSKGLAALKVTTAAAAVNVSQTVLTPSGIQKQGYVRLLYKIPATITDAQICSLVDAAEQNCVPSNKLIANGLYNQIEIPLIFGTTSAGWKIETTATYTQDVFIDNVILAQGLGTQNLMLDNVYSAKASAAGVLTDLNKTGWISFTSLSDTSLFNYTLSGFTSAPNCTATTRTSDTSDNYTILISSVSATSLSVRTKYNDAAVPNGVKYPDAHNIICQKSGNDYLASSANVYSSTNGNYDWTSYTPTFTGFGTTSAIQIQHRRMGGNLEIRGKFTSGTSTAVEARISLPDALVSAGTSIIPSIQQIGAMSKSAQTATYFTVLIEPSVSYLTFGAQNAGLAGLTKQNGNALISNGESFSFFSSIPIQGWTNSNLIVGSFANLNTSKELVKADSESPVFVKKTATTISVKAGTILEVSNAAIKFDTETPVVMPTLAAGTDYAIYFCTDKTARADANFTSPTGYTVDQCKKTGGFHYGLVGPTETVAGGSFATTGNGMIWTQPDVDQIKGINAYSIWDLKFRPKSLNPRGMALIAGQFWMDIYLTNTNHEVNGTSKYNSDVASGTVLPKKPTMFGGNGTATYADGNWWNFGEIARAHGKRFPTHPEFSVAAFGVTENQSLGGASSTIPATKREAGYTSKWGLEQTTGHQWTWGAEISSYAAASSYVSAAGRGSYYAPAFSAPLHGGDRGAVASSGSRASFWNIAPTASFWYIGLRAACDHLKLP